MTTAIFGRWAEQKAGEYLASRGYTIVERNYRKPWGEIDIIAKKKDVLIFVEVKANQHPVAGFEPELRADRRKQEKIIRTARTYILERKLPENQEWQIDVISIMLRRERGIIAVKHFRNI